MAAENSTWPLWLADNQALFAKHPDVFSWQTHALEQDVTIRGNVAANLFASTSGGDADWVKVLDIYPVDESTPRSCVGEVPHPLTRHSRPPVTATSSASP